MQEHFMDMDGVQELLRMARTGLWTIELEEGREPRMYGDKAMLELLGLKGMPSPEECYREWYDRIDHDFYPMIETGVDEMIRNKRAEVQYPWEHPLWGTIYVRCGGVRDESYENGICLRGYHQNITDTIMLREKARLRDNVLSNLCQCYYSIYLFDLDNDVEEAIWQEDYIEKAGAFPKGSLKVYYEKFIREHVYPQDQEKMRRAGSPEFLKQILSEDRPVYDIDFRRQYPDRVQWVRSRFSVAQMKDASVSKVVFANMNIHQQKINEMQQEEENRKALMTAYETAKEASEAKSNFLAQMSHDIRTPMNAIIGMTAIAMSHSHEPERVEDCLKKINMSSSHLLALIDDVLDMSRIEKGKMQLMDGPFCMDKLVGEVLTIIRPSAEEKGHLLKVDTEDLKHRRLIGDSGRLRQVLLNLLSNSVKYTPGNGIVKLTVKEVAQRVAGFGNFVFIVEDSGIGMTEAFREYIFVPFLRDEKVREEHIQGTGLGMPITQGIVNAMQGSIQVESEPGRGSRFTVTLSLKLDEEEQKEEDVSGKIVDAGRHRDVFSGRNIRVLVAEDNEINMEIVRTILGEAGISTEGAFNGQEALSAFEASEDGYFKAILMDLQMPVMDGYTAARKIRESVHPQAADIPVIALTANAFAEDIAKALAAGMNDHVAKPIDYERLFGVLEKCLV
jgi:signal transduction histidine kinase/ActR/RegA family two-component response regulator